jgi:hypothetical protein
MFDLIAANPEGVTRDQLFRRMYGNKAADLGSIYQTASTQLHRLRAALKGTGLTVKNLKGGGRYGAIYVIAEDDDGS